MKKQSRRSARMMRAHGKKKTVALNLVSLMDVFTILVFFLLVNSSSSETLQQPKEIVLPDSVAEKKPEETVVIMITENAIMVQGEEIASIEELLASEENIIPVLKSQLEGHLKKSLGISQRAENSRAANIMGHKTIPFQLLKKVMATSTSAGYGKISLAVIQKASQQ